MSPFKTNSEKLASLYYLCILMLIIAIATSTISYLSTSRSRRQISKLLGEYHTRFEALASNHVDRVEDVTPSSSLGLPFIGSPASSPPSSGSSPVPLSSPSGFISSKYQGIVCVRQPKMGQSYLQCVKGDGTIVYIKPDELQYIQ